MFPELTALLVLGSQHVYPVDAPRSEVGHRGQSHRAGLSRVLGLAGLTRVLGLTWLGLVLWSQELGRLGPAGGFFGEVRTPSEHKECYYGETSMVWRCMTNR